MFPTLLETLHLVSNETLNRNTSRHSSALKSSHHHLELASSQVHGRRFHQNLDVQVVYLVCPELNCSAEHSIQPPYAYANAGIL